MMRNSASALVDAISPTTVGAAMTIPPVGALIETVAPCWLCGGANRASTCAEETFCPTSTRISAICSPSRSGRTRISVCGTTAPMTTSVSEKQARVDFTAVTAMLGGSAVASALEDGEIKRNNTAATIGPMLAAAHERRLSRALGKTRILGLAPAAFIHSFQRGLLPRYPLP